MDYYNTSYYAGLSFSYIYNNVQQFTKVSRFIRKEQEIRVILDFFIKKLQELFVIKKKVVPLHSQSSNKRLPKLKHWDMV